MPTYGSLHHFEGIKPCFSEAILSATQLEQIRKAQEGIFSFCKLAQQYIHESDDANVAVADWHLIGVLLLRAIVCPTHFEIHLFHDWQHEYNLGTKKTELLIPKKNWLRQTIKGRSITKIIEELNRHQVQWLGAALMQIGGESFRDMFMLLQFKKYNI